LGRYHPRRLARIIKFVFFFANYIKHLTRHLQTRRLNIRCKAQGPGSGPKPFAFTLNGTALAVPRIILAILETHQQKDGSICVPPMLQPFMGGKDVLMPLQ
jgi:seryl-tRNA synthetase